MTKLTHPKVLRADTVERMKAVYKILKENSKPKNGLWLDTYGYNKDFLASYDDTIDIFFSSDIGGMAKVANMIGVSHTRLNQLMGSMRACGFIHHLHRGIWVVLEEPSEESFQESRLRAKIPFAGDGPQSGLRSLVMDYIAGMNSRMDNMQTAITQLARRVEELDSKNTKK